MELVTLLILIVAVVCLVWLGIWVIDSTLPEPIRPMAKVIVGIIALIIIVYALFGISGVNLGTVRIGR